jgi:hypothetical protein
MPTSESSPARIELKLRCLSEMFAAFDASPLVDRDIDNALEEFIVESALDAGSRRNFLLVIHLPADAAAADESELTRSVRNYFAYMRDRQLGRLRQLWRDGRQALAAGMAFLLACTALSQVSGRFAEGALAAFLTEGLLILGWVANWRPVEIFLYDWRPLHRKGQIYARLARLELQIVRDPAAT